MVKPTSGLVTVRLPRAVQAAVDAGYCTSAVLRSLEAAGCRGQLCHHLLHSIGLFTDPENVAGIASMDRTGSSLWYSASSFIDYLFASGLLSAGCRVCEVGAGCGAVGLALHFAMGCDVTLTDQPQMLPLLYLNAGLNAHLCKSSTGMPSFASLPWGLDAAADAVLSDAGGSYDFIIGSDVTYEPASHDALLLTLARLAQGLPNGAPVILAAPDHKQPSQTTSNSLRDGFLDRCALHGWRVETVEAVRKASGWQDGAASKSVACPIVILVMRPPPPPRRCRVPWEFESTSD